MALTVRLLFDDGRCFELAYHCETLRDAADTAFRLAEAHGQCVPHGDRPRWVRVYREEHLELSVQVIDGGLSAPVHRQRA